MHPDFSELSRRFIIMNQVTSELVWHLKEGWQTGKHVDTMKPAMDEMFTNSAYNRASFIQQKYLTCAYAVHCVYSIQLQSHPTGTLATWQYQHVPRYKSGEPSELLRTIKASILVVHVNYSIKSQIPRTHTLALFILTYPRIVQFK